MRSADTVMDPLHALDATSRAVTSSVAVAPVPSTTLNLPLIVRNGYLSCARGPKRLDLIHYRSTRETAIAELD